MTLLHLQLHVAWGINMRYILHNTFQNEISSRQNYLYEVFHLWFIPFSYTSDFIQLISIPSSIYFDTCFILGHNNCVKSLLKERQFPEKKIVAITCDGNANFRKLFLPQHQLYIAHQNKSNYASLFKGSEYCFNFDLTESELLLYNSSATHSLADRISTCFTKL